MRFGSLALVAYDSAIKHSWPRPSSVRRLRM
ncbi:hypothetical protein MT49_2079 [Mycobacterium tuberculosis 49-02]|uniref:Uncharacterized protein n=1 Tax=Mycobacterium tuberculosis (strain CDC 1551 / Oshkosh) TaxID=83331 RepID=Q8VJU1_MYCTO|nr:hypothetical protein MT1978 [Mycobacterium tuberculosis CDC1551]CDM10233.1 hypothetical protein MT49_2079 [Mycobacterium tuberculosis 49-02]